MAYRTGSNSKDPLFKPVSDNGYYTVEESEALSMTERFKQANGKSYVTITDMLFILKTMGWTMDNEGKQKCTKCGQWQDINYYNKDRRHKNGHRSECKTCSNSRYKRKGKS